jgi:hypothetical protein
MVSLVNTAAANLNDFVIDTLCPMDWDRMDGDGRKRFCSRCEKTVYNIAEMTDQEALELIGNGDRSICARIFRRPDGTIVTRRCPVPGAKTTGRRFQFSIATLITLLTSSAALFASAPWIGRQIEPIVQRWFGEPQPIPAVGKLLCEMGDVAMMPPATQVSVPPITVATPADLDPID